ncbi:replication restart DNA helicase PriA [Bacillus oleivorans]|uniref:Replication restart protein PriA n=1 Tax=Bacillus oleivorans TaxID=1448271 RepID=A0A285D1I3_9BACI|nr:replication restart DNA helicase PriA [Bacillus oleivorans]
MIQVKVAKVIVDVPAAQTDHTFSYRFPEVWVDLIVPGIRVVVPFGPRKIQGIVVETLTEEDENLSTKLKSIEEPLDLTPVFTPELLQLAAWLSEETLCFQVAALQAMLPAAMKAKYQKKIVYNEMEIPEELQELFKNRKEASWERAMELNIVPLLQKKAKTHELDIVYEVKEKNRKKKVKMIRSKAGKEKLQELIITLPPQASKQKELLQFFLTRNESVTLQELKEYGFSSQSIRSLVEKDVLEEQSVEVYRDPFEHKTFEPTEPLPLTDEQQAAIAPILQAVEENKFETFLLYGVTGSGKTEVYLQTIQEVLKQGKEAIVLVPEISLTPQIVARFKGRFGDQVAVLHSGLSIGEKYDEWRKIHRKEVKVAVGARSAIFAPFDNLGVIIIDEEHESSYKQEENPRYHARDVAKKRGAYHQCPIILGSATPSLESFARAQKGVYTLLQLTKRMNNRDLPSVEIVDMRNELRDGNRSMFSKKLVELLQDRLDKHEQTVLFLNKRGYSSFVMCRDCGYVMNCPYCDLSMTYHRATSDMKCHYCGYHSHVPATCPECSSKHIRYFGTGTQKVEEELGRLFPEARVIRMDVDTTGRKGAHEKLLSAFERGEADILLGTQMIAKGLDFPNITLVGVLTADTMLHLPDFRASERTFQLLTQVSGRAGRHDKPGEVIIQTYTPEHYSILLSGKQDFLEFYQREMMTRKQFQYPPFYYLALIHISHEDVLKTASIAENISHYLQKHLSSSSIILGPVASPIARINNRYRYQCLIKYKREPELMYHLKKIVHQFQEDTRKNGVYVSVDVQPYVLM